MIKELLATAGIASLPLAEQRLAIPLGYAHWDLTIWEATIAATLGNILSVALVLWLWPIIARLASTHSPFCDRILQKIFDKTRTKHSHKFETWGAIFLIFFVMLPIPGSGGWSGSLIAWLFGVKYREAMKLITIGLILGAIIMASLTVGVNASFHAITEAFAEHQQ